MRVACIGEAMIELTQQGGAAHLGVAGDTLNTAIYLKRSAPELEVEYITCLGDDPFSGQICDFIGAQGIGCDGIRTIAGGTPGLYAITTEAGERSFTYWRNQSAARQMFQDEAGFEVLKDYDLLYLSGITMAILPPSVRAGFLDWLGQGDARLAYDSNYRPRLWDSADAARAVTDALWSRCDIALPSVDDEMALFEQDAAAVTARLRAYGCRGALKRGAEGPLSLGSDVVQSYAPAPRIVDTTAAGDSFNGGYLAALLTGGDQAAALRAGHDCAARVVQFPGAIIPV
ncbi:sugar kinase [uncultured Roseobacter sp.]|uniref:sugar kinase n=1 Tax=uncultured Roseobacter sp. TaxID=114847 RepID=UPI00260540AE|nr:sugar kinase [uncultured Roseobacter sp.]